MKKRRNVLSAAVAVLMAAFFVFGFMPMANAALSTNVSADVVIGQPDMLSDMPNHGISPVLTANDQMYLPRAPFFDGSKFFVTDMLNNRVLIYNSIPTSNGASADVVVGQPDMTSNSPDQGGSSPSANTLEAPAAVFSDGSKLIILDGGNNRVLIYNSIPTSNNASADVVIGQPDMTSDAINQGSSAAANTLNAPSSLFFDGKKLFVSDWENNRILIFNDLPTTNNASASLVIGQQDLTSSSANQGGSVAANTLDHPNGIWGSEKKLYIADQYNQRVLIYNTIPVSNNASADVVVGQPYMTSNGENQGGSVAANTMLYPTHVFPYGPKMLVLDGGNSRLLVFNSIPTSNNANADVAIGQPNLVSGDPDQGGDTDANTLYNPRGLMVANSKLIIGDYYNNRVLIYNSFGAQWAISKNHSQVLSGGEKVKVKAKKIEFSGKNKEYKKGRVRIVVDGVSKKVVKIGNSGKWSAKFVLKGSAVKNVVIKYYNSHRNLQMNSETYTLGIRTGVSALTLKKATLNGSSHNSEKPSEMGDGFKMPKVDFRGM
jgi:hypothetical protein